MGLPVSSDEVLTFALSGPQVSLFQSTHGSSFDSFDWSFAKRRKTIQSGFSGIHIVCGWSTAGWRGAGLSFGLGKGPSQSLSSCYVVLSIRRFGSLCIHVTINIA